MSQTNISMSLANPHPANYNTTQKTGLAFIGIAVLAIVFAWLNIGLVSPLYYFICMIIGLFVGGAIYFYGSYGSVPEGIKNNRNFFGSMTSRGALAWITGIVITGFYICLYFKEDT
ncbi:MAG: hypothetical protein ACK4IY_06950, partial [Chitinophagales bacterium]